MSTFHLTVARVGESVFDGDVSHITLPGTDGVFTVLAHHEPFVSPLKNGEVHIAAADGKKLHFEIAHGGVAEVSSNQVTVLL